MGQAAPILVRSPRFLADDALLAESREDRYRGSGPGGQKRNKTSNAVRLVHGPTGVTVTATECRSLNENRVHAIHRLRAKLAADVREPVDLARFSPPDWFLSIRHDTRIEASHKHPFHAPAAGLALDLLAAVGGNPAAVAANLGVSTTAVAAWNVRAESASVAMDSASTRPVPIDGVSSGTVSAATAPSTRIAPGTCSARASTASALRPAATVTEPRATTSRQSRSPPTCRPAAARSAPATSRPTRRRSSRRRTSSRSRRSEP